MAQVATIDSNATGLRYAVESTIGVLPGSPIWNQLEPNNYSDFGGELALIARNPINDGRQRQKGVITDLDADGGFEFDFVQDNNDEILEGAMFAEFDEKGVEVVTAVDLDTANPDEYEVALTAGFFVNSLIKGFDFTNAANNALNVVTAIVADTSVEVADGQLVAETPPATANIKVVGYQGTAGDIDVDASGDLPILTTTSLDWTTLGLSVGEFIYIGGDSAALGFATAANNGFKRIRSIAANALTLDKSELTMVTEASTTETVQIFFGKTLKNKTGTDIVRTTFQLERTLGAPDNALPAEIQSEYVTGAVVNELNVNIPTADKLMAEVSFIGLDHEQRTGATGVKSGSRPTLVAKDAYNTSSDFGAIKMAVVSDTDESPTPLFTYITELNLTINNNLSANKAVGTLGAIEITAGTFEVSAEITAYFNNVAAVTAVRNNSDVTIHAEVVKSNAGFVVDLPLIALGNGRLEVEQDEAITLPLDAQAAAGNKISTDMNHTLFWSVFPYLPDAADA